MPHNNHAGLTGGSNGTSGGSGSSAGSGNGNTSGNASSGDDLGSTDEIKVFDDEGDHDDEKLSSENLLEEKSSLIDLTESEDKSGNKSSRQDTGGLVFGKVEPQQQQQQQQHSHAASFNMGYLVPPYPYTNGTAGGLAMANKMALSPFFCHNGEHLTSPPPAHCGIAPYQLDPKTMVSGLSRLTIYPFPTRQYAYPMLSPDMSQVASWHTPSVYSPATGFRSPYPSSLPINTTLPSDFYRFSPGLLPHSHHHVLNSHPAIVTPGPKQEISPESNHRYGRPQHDQKSMNSMHNENNSNGGPGGGNNNNMQTMEQKEAAEKKKMSHIKKPLNAFMLYMKEMRPKVVAECTLKESAAINQILGRRWHSLSREEQSKYYEKARQERQAHMEQYPGWCARDNYGCGSKKKKRKKDRSPADSSGNNMKKCRARYGLDQQSQWCKPCRRKKKCIRYMQSDSDDPSSQHHENDNNAMDENMGSCNSDIRSPDDDTESLNQSLSSPGGMSVLSSLQSPSTGMGSPLNLLHSPLTPNHIMDTSIGLNSYLMSTNSKNSGGNGQNSDLSRNEKSNSSNNSNNNKMNNSDIHMFDTSFIKTESIPSPSSTLSPTPSSAAMTFSRQSSQHHQQQQQSSRISSGSATPSHMLNHHDNFYEKSISTVRNPVGANPRDINNPLSINQLTKRDYINHNSPSMQHHLVGGSPSTSQSSSSSTSPQLHHHQFQQQLQQHHQQQQQLQHNLHLQSSLVPQPTSSSSSSSSTSTSATTHPSHHHLHHHHNSQLHHHHQALSALSSINHHIGLTHHHFPSLTQTTSSSAITPTNQTAKHHRAGDDAGAISVT